MKTVCEFRYDEGLRFFKDDVCGTIRTIDGGGCKFVIEFTNPADLEKLKNNTFDDDESDQ